MNRKLTSWARKDQPVRQVGALLPGDLEQGFKITIARNIVQLACQGCIGHDEQLQCHGFLQIRDPMVGGPWVGIDDKKQLD